MNDIERRALIGAAGIGALAALSKAGPLNPPGGSIAPTGRTLDEVYNRIGATAASSRTVIPASSSVVNISASGSYVLSGNITVASGNGININASGVTLDLNGYTVISTAVTGTGINVNGVANRTAIRNGNVANFQTGVFIGGGAVGVTIEDLTVVAARINGILISNGGFGSGTVVRRCTIADTGYNTGAADSGTTISAISAGASVQLIEDCVISNVFHFASGSQTRRGIFVTIADLTSTLINRCYFANTEFTTATAVYIPSGGQGYYRNCTVQNFSTGYSGGTSGGGNV